MEKEGSSAIIYFLKNHEGLDAILGEPFDKHQFFKEKSGGLGKYISLEDLETCLDLFWGEMKDSSGKEALLDIYKKYNNNPERHRKIVDFLPSNPRGFKKRLIWGISDDERELYLRLMKRHQVCLFVLFRKDVFKWALSRYKAGHLQFALMNGTIKQADIGPIHYDPVKLREIIQQNERLHKRKHQLISLAESRGVRSYPIYYEDFLYSKRDFLSQILTHLQLPIVENKILATLSQEIAFKKVHSDNPRDVISNYDEIVTHFGNYLR